MIYEGVLHTPYDGTFVNPEITWFRRDGRWIVEVNGNVLAYLDKETHRLWTRNPGLRERIVQQIQAETLVWP